MTGLSIQHYTAIIPTGIAFIICGQLISRQRLSWGKTLLAFLFYYVEGFVATIFLGADSPYKMLLIVACYLLVFRTIHGFKGQRLLLNAFSMLLVTFTADIIAGLVCMSIFTSQEIAEMRYMLTVKTYVLQCCSGFMMVFNALLWRGGAMLLRRLSRLRGLGYIIRPLLMFLTIGILFMLALLRVEGTDQVVRLQQVLPDFIVIILLLVTGATYIVQDIRHFRQVQENNTLLYQQSLQQLLLQDTRVFRHNIANMLYGLQGMLLRGDMDELNAYYRYMIESCQIINNDNVVALKRIPSMAISSLLLNKVQEANAERIPFYVTVEENVHWHGLSEVDMTVLLGILIDNALEAAREASAPYVSFEARSSGRALALTIRNTYRDGEPPVFTFPMSSTKPGHSGLGLRTVEKMLAKKSNVLFNIYPQGRYVEASLVCY